MFEKRVWLLAIVILATALIAGFATAQEVLRNPGTIIKVDPDSLETLDPHLMVSTSSMEIPNNVYDSLLIYDRSAAIVIPGLATEVPSLDNGLIIVRATGVTITFPIRQGVKFHSGDVLTPEDVKYTFERALVIGGTSDTVRPLGTALLEGSFQDLVDRVGYDAAFDRLDRAIEVSGQNVVFNLEKPFAPFVTLMADNGLGLGIMCKRWAIEEGCWPGTKETGQAHMGLTVQDDPLFDKMNGTGPFKMVEWVPNERVVLKRFEEYWRGPAEIETVIRRYVPDTSARLLQLKAGDADIVRLMPADLAQLEGEQGIKFEKRIPSFWLIKLNFNFDIKSTEYIGSGELDGKGIPRNFFTDIDVRKAFCYAFDQNAFLQDVYLGQALKPYGVIPIGMPFANSHNPQYSYDPQKAIEYFKKAWGGQVWEKGFRFTVFYATGATHWERFAEILKANIEALNPKFHIDTNAVLWATMMGLIQGGTMPVHNFGLIPAVPDSYLVMEDQMYSKGFYADICHYQVLAEERYDSLVETVKESFDPELRKEAAYDLQRLCYEDALALIYWQDATTWAMRDYVYGFKPSLSPMGLDYYNFRKGSE